MSSLQDNNNHKGNGGKGPSKKQFFIDNQHFETEADSLSVRSLLVDFAKDDPALTTLELKSGDRLTPLTDLDYMVEMEPGMHFVVFHNEPTQVS